MSNYNNSKPITNILDDESDDDFYGNKNSEYSNSNNNAVLNTPNSNLEEKSIKDTKEPSKNESLEKSYNENDYSSDEDVSSISNSVHSVSKSSKLSKSDVSKTSKLYHSKDNCSNQSSLSAQSSSRIHQSVLKSSHEGSDVTSVSSLESENLSQVLPRPQNPKYKSNKFVKSSKYHTHLQSPIDMDIVPPDVIRQAMFRLEEARVHMQKMKPKWIDPNSKDYSLSGIAQKMNMNPERIVSIPQKKNIRRNPFYFNAYEPEQRLYHSAINRGKEKDRIERENLEIKSRLQRIRPSPGITKEELLREYSKVNRFSVQQSNKSRIIPFTSSYRPQSSTNSINLKIRRTNSSTAVSRLLDSRQSNSVKSTPKRVMSANSLASNHFRNNSRISAKKRN